MIIHVGDVGCGDTAKLINNMIAFGCSQITFEGIVLGVKAGIDERLLREVIKNSSGPITAYRTVCQIYSPVF